MRNRIKKALRIFSNTIIIAYLFLSTAYYTFSTNSKIYKSAIILIGLIMVVVTDLAIRKLIMESFNKYRGYLRHRNQDWFNINCRNVIGLLSIAISCAAIAVSGIIFAKNTEMNIITDVIICLVAKFDYNITTTTYYPSHRRKK